MYCKLKKKSSKPVSYNYKQTPDFNTEFLNSQKLIECY